MTRIETDYENDDQEVHYYCDYKKCKKLVISTMALDEGQFLTKSEKAKQYKIKIYCSSLHEKKAQQNIT